ncbi:expressed unknown protein [Seminavis robusta]|uniref:Uncharacterized protein n=1 Tax=Seminavis robusta TaxID=568900 RepID=A0A9N8EMB4_9STRA|nr:expressed unknown protein [Seminavis robusta]|eukprot:Sro1452_g273920.1 n/a (143) ;mRNA; f:20091-20519
MLHLKDPPATKVHQDDFSPGKGNALQACVASLFDQPLDEVPNFIELDCGYEQGIQDYLQQNKSSYTAVKKKPSNDNTDNDTGKLCILRGKSPRGDFGHVIVARVVEGGDKETTFTPVHDPHPEGTFLDNSEPFGWYMTFEKA